MAGRRMSGKPITVQFAEEMLEAIDAAAQSVDMPLRTFVTAVCLGALKTGRAQELAMAGHELLPPTQQGRPRMRPDPRQWVSVVNAEAETRAFDWVSPPYRIIKTGSAIPKHAKPGDGWYLQGPGFPFKGEFVGNVRRLDAIKRAEELIRIHEANWPEVRLPNG